MDGLPVLGNTEEIFAAEHDDLHLPAQAARVSHRIAQTIARRLSWQDPACEESFPSPAVRRLGVNSGKPVRRLRLGERLWPSEQEGEVQSAACVTAGVYSVHTATAIKSHERDRLERLVRYMARPAISDERITALDDNTIRL